MVELGGTTPVTGTTGDGTGRTAHGGPARGEGTPAPAAQRR